MMAVGKEMMTSGGDGNTFETRMESFGENIEQEMESRAEKIKFKANELCLAAVNIDKLEEQLKASIEPLEKIDVLATSHRMKKHIDDKSAM